jgi:hypothetical protein
MVLKAPVICTCDGFLLSTTASSWFRVAVCDCDRQRWQRLHGVSLHTPSAVQLSVPVLAMHAQELVVSALSQNCPPATLQSVLTAHVPAGLLMLSIG